MAYRGGKRTAKKTSLEMRRAQALKLRRAGHSYSEIGEKLGVATSQAFQAVKSGLELIREEATETARDVLALELQRLDELLQMLMPKATSGGKNAMAAVDRVLRVQERRAKYLGLDQAKKIQAEVVGPEVYLPKGRQKMNQNLLEDRRIDDNGEVEFKLGEHSALTGREFIR